MIFLLSLIVTRDSPFLFWDIRVLYDHRFTFFQRWFDRIIQRNPTSCPDRIINLWEYITIWIYNSSIHYQFARKTSFRSYDKNCVDKNLSKCNNSWWRRERSGMKIRWMTVTWISIVRIWYLQRNIVYFANVYIWIWYWSRDFGIRRVWMYVLSSWNCNG